MYRITKNKKSGNFELVRTRDGRVMDSQSIEGAHIALAIAQEMARRQPHATGHLWRAAALVTSDRVDFVPENEQCGRNTGEGFVTIVAIVNGYIVERVQQPQPAVSAPMPQPIYICECDFFIKARSGRPIIAGMPVCKHILAGMMTRQIVTNLAHWEQLIAERQQTQRDTFGKIQEGWRREELQQQRKDNYAMRYAPTSKQGKRAFAEMQERTNQLSAQKQGF